MIPFNTNDLLTELDRNKPMKVYEVEQYLQCDVKVVYLVEAPTMETALAIASRNDNPTSVEGMKYELLSDRETTATSVQVI